VLQTSRRYELGRTGKRGAAVYLRHERWGGSELPFTEDHPDGLVSRELLVGLRWSFWSPCGTRSERRGATEIKRTAASPGGTAEHLASWWHSRDARAGGAWHISSRGSCWAFDGARAERLTGTWLAEVVAMGSWAMKSLLVHRKSLVWLVPLAVLAQARAAAACGQAAEAAPVLLGLPAADQDQVPTDVVPVYDLEALLRGSGVLLLDSFGFSLRDTQGEEVALTEERVGSLHLALRPAAELRPFTTYVIEARVPLVEAPEQAVQLSFTTGAGRLGELPLPLLSASLERFLTAQGGGAACELTEGLCVALPPGEWFEVTFLDPSQDVPPPTLHAGPYLTYLPPVTIPPSGLCIQLRRRAINGLFSPPEVVCGSFNQVSVLGGSAASSCTENGLVEVERLSSASNLDDVNGSDQRSPEASSCSIGRGASGTGRGSATALIAGACVLLRRRARTASTALRWRGA